MRKVFFAICLGIGVQAFAQQEISFIDQLTPIADAQIDGQFGASIATDGQYLIIGAPRTTSSVGDHSGVVYIYKLAVTWNLIATLTSPNPHNSGNFGYDVDIDGNYIVVGAIDEDILKTNSGVVYVYTKPTDEWHNSDEGVMLWPSDSSIVAFGNSVAISGDYVIAGGKYNKSAFLYNKSSLGWEEGTELAKLMPSDPTNLNAPESFGYSVDIKGDLVLIGSPEHDLGSVDEGAAYIFERPDTGWQDMTETAKLTSISSDDNNKFGNSVSIGTDYVAIGAYREDGGVNGIGAAYIFTKPLDGWKNATESAKMTASDAVLLSDFGISVLAQDNFLFVGSNYRRTEGAVYIFSKSNGEWITGTENHKIIPNNQNSRSTFGYSVSVLGNEIIIGDSEIGGLAEVFQTTDASWIDASYKISLSNSFLTSSQDKFGSSVAFDNNIAVVGAFGDDFEDESTGAAYVFEFKDNNWQRLAKLSASNSNRYDRAGLSVDIKDDLIIIGAPGKDDLYNDFYDAGVVYAFKKPTEGWSDMNETQILQSLSPRIRGNFGNSVAIGTDYIVVGEDDIGSSGSLSKVYLFGKTPDNSIDPSGILLAAENDIGSELDVYNDVIVAAYQRTRGSKVKIFEKGVDGWNSANITTINAPAELGSFSSFGSSVAIFGNNLAIGASYTNHNEEKRAGSVYLFTRSTDSWKDSNFDTIAFVNPAPTIYSRFGAYVSLSDKYLLIVGLIGDNVSDSAQVWRIRKDDVSWDPGYPMIELAKPESFHDLDFEFGSPVVIRNELVLVGSFDADLPFNDNSGMVVTYDLTAPRITFDGPESISENVISIKMGLSEPVISFTDEVFEIINSRITNITKVSELEYILDLAVIEEDSIFLSLPANVLFDAEGNPNYRADFKANYNPILGVNEIVNQKYSIYPNPTSNTLNLNFIDQRRRIISIKDSHGRERISTITNEQNLILDLQEYWSGLYFVTIQEEGLRSSFKIIVY